jgi:excisionase family DNA binding protein
VTDVQPEFVSALDAARILAISRSEVYKLLDQGDLDGFKRGSRHLIEYASVRDYANRLRQEAKVSSVP